MNWLSGCRCGDISCAFDRDASDTTAMLVLESSVVMIAFDERRT